MAIRGRRLALLLWLLPAPLLADAIADGLAAWRAGDYSQAHAMWLPAAEAGDPQAKFLLSELYAHGKGVAQDQAVALSWLTEAAEGGYAPACYNLGDRYLNGLGVVADPAKAAFWWRRAAVQGLMLAQYNLGTLYYRGLGLPADPVQAAWWYRQAAAQGSRPARDALAALRRTGVVLPPDEPAPQLEPSTEWTAAPRPKAERVDLPQAASAAGPAAAVAPGAESSTRVRGAEASGPALSALALGPDWLRRQPADHFILQVFASDEGPAVARFLNLYRFSRQVAVYPFRKGGQRWYGVTYGRFTSHDEARAALAELPAAVQKGRPWVRQVRDVTGIMDAGED